MIGMRVPLEAVAGSHREVRDEYDCVLRAVRTAGLTIWALTVWQHNLAGYPDYLAA
jgi:hypothetical protein